MIQKDTTRNSFLKPHHEMILCIMLVGAVLAVYLPVRNFDFVNYDDNVYITGNHHVQQGFTTDNIIWALTTTHGGNWHPLTWLSHMMDDQIFGMNSGAHHLTNLFFHIANSLLLFFLFRKMTGDFWKSGFVAALFALHPLHVESVAWVSERKDVLSTFFFLLTILSYFSWARNFRTDTYLAALLFFILGLLAKPMLVTLPFVLLLLDCWPLYRMSIVHRYTPGAGEQRFGICQLILEKIPFFVLTAAACATTFLAQNKGGAVRSLDVYPLNIRIGNALISYVKYLVKLFLPQNMTVLYQYPGKIWGWEVIGAVLVLSAVSIGAVRILKKSPYFAVGWFWFLGTLVPVIGIIQVGSQAMADRYMYIPSIGLFIIIAWAVPEIASHFGRKKVLLPVLALVFFVFLTVISCKQVTYWKNSITLFEHAIEITPYNALPHNNLGNAFIKIGLRNKAIRHYLKALQFKPDYYEAHNNLATVLEKEGRTDEAVRHYLEALRINPDFSAAHYNLANTLAKQGHIDEAIQHYLEALRIKPNFEKAHNNLGVALIHKGDVKAAEYHFRAALRINADYISAKNNLENLLKNR